MQQGTTKEALYRAALDLWGVNAQLLLAIEEMAELTQALCKKINRQEQPHWVGREIIEELVDVEIMIEQLKEIFIRNLQAKSLFEAHKTQQLNNLADLISQSIQNKKGEDQCTVI